MLKNYFGLKSIIKSLFLKSFLIIVLFSFNVSLNIYAQYYGDEMMELKSESLINGSMNPNRSGKSVVIRSDTAYIVNDYGFLIYDVSDPVFPDEIGHIGIPSTSNRLVMDGNYAYISCYKSGFTIVNIQDPTSPFITSFTKTNKETHDIAINGNIVYLSNPEGVSIYNVEDHNSPQLINEYDFTGGSYPAPYTLSLPPSDLTTNILYYNTARNLYTLDITNPTEPVVVHQEEFNQNSGNGYTWATPVFQNNYMYIANNMALHIYDISIPASPQLVYESLDCFPATIYSIAIDGNMLILTHWQQGWGTVDISNPVNPQLIHYYSQTYGPGFGAAALEGNTLYLNNNQKGNYAGWRTRIIDISDPSNAVLLGQIEPDEEGYVCSHEIIKRDNNKYAIVAQEDYTNNYGAYSYAGILRILDVTYPNNTNLISTLEIPAKCVAVAAEGDYAVARGYRAGAYGYKNYIYLINISNLSNPYIGEEKFIYAAFGYYFPYSLCLHNGLLYVVTIDALKIYKITPGSTLDEIGSYVINTVPNSINVRDEGSSIYAYVTSHDGGFEIYDVSNPANIYLKSYYYNGGVYLDAHIQDNYAYAVLFDTTVQIIDITDNNCVPVNKFYVTGENAWGINVENNLAFVYTSTNLDRYLNVIDINDPLNPVDFGTYRTSGNVQTTSLSDNGKYMYVSDYYDFTIYHPLFNFKPLPFSLLMPEDDSQFLTNDDINFGWEKSIDADDDTLSYTMKVWNSDWDTSLITQDTTFIVNVNNLPDSGNYNWTVIASDEMYEQYAVDTFSFNYQSDVGINNELSKIPERNELLNNYPNPFDNKITITFSTTGSSKVKIMVFNLQGMKICTLFDNTLARGYHKIVWNGKNDLNDNLTEGIYFIKMQGKSLDRKVNNFISIKKIIKVKK